jgi:transcriptional regulator with XRE-family HTH domain
VRRRTAHLTQAQLAEAAGFSVVYISMLERGSRQPQRTTVALLADALDLSAPEHVALAATAQAPAADAAWRRGDDTGSTHLPFGGFLGAVPTSPLVGRERELALLKEALGAVAGGHGPLSPRASQPQLPRGGRLFLRLRPTVTLAQLALVAGTRWQVEQAFELAKGEVGILWTDRENSKVGLLRAVGWGILASNLRRIAQRLVA